MAKRLARGDVHPRTTHGNASDPLYKVWCSMKARCSNPNLRAYQWYGAKGVKVCNEWHTWETFRDWANAHGYARGLVIDRVDPNGNYEPSNCQWITQSENAKRVTR